MSVWEEGQGLMRGTWEAGTQSARRQQPHVNLPTYLPAWCRPCVCVGGLCLWCGWCGWGGWGGWGRWVFKGRKQAGWKMQMEGEEEETTAPKPHRTDKTARWHDKQCHASGGWAVVWVFVHVRGGSVQGEKASFEPEEMEENQRRQQGWVPPTTTTTPLFFLLAWFFFRTQARGHGTQGGEMPPSNLLYFVTQSPPSLPPSTLQMGRRPSSLLHLWCYFLLPTRPCCCIRLIKRTSKSSFSLSISARSSRAWASSRCGCNVHEMRCRGPFSIPPPTPPTHHTYLQAQDDRARLRAQQHLRLHQLGLELPNARLVGRLPGGHRVVLLLVLLGGAADLLLLLLLLLGIAAVLRPGIVGEGGHAALRPALFRQRRGRLLVQEHGGQQQGLQVLLPVLVLVCSVWPSSWALGRGGVLLGAAGSSSSPYWGRDHGCCWGGWVSGGGGGVRAWMHGMVRCVRTFGGRRGRGQELVLGRPPLAPKVAEHGLVLDQRLQRLRLGLVGWWWHGCGGGAVGGGCHDRCASAAGGRGGMGVRIG